MSHLKLYDRQVKYASVSITITSKDQFDETIIHRSMQNWNLIGFNVVDSRFEEHELGECDLTYTLKYDGEAQDFIELAPKVNEVFKSHYEDYHFLKISFVFENNSKETHHYQIFRMPGTLEILRDLTSVAEHYYGNETRAYEMHRNNEQLVLMNMGGKPVPMMWRKNIC